MSKRNVLYLVIDSFSHRAYHTLHQTATICPHTLSSSKDGTFDFESLFKMLVSPSFAGSHLPPGCVIRYTPCRTPRASFRILCLDRTLTDIEPLWPFAGLGRIRGNHARSLEHAQDGELEWIPDTLHRFQTNLSPRTRHPIPCIVTEVSLNIFERHLFANFPKNLISFSAKRHRP